LKRFVFGSEVKQRSEAFAGLSGFHFMRFGVLSEDCRVAGRQIDRDDGAVVLPRKLEKTAVMGYGLDCRVGGDARPSQRTADRITPDQPPPNH